MGEASAREEHTVFVVSDATGSTARIVVEAALAQFKDASVTVERIAGVRTVDEVKQIVQKAAAVRGTIVHTLVLEELRGAMLTGGYLYHVNTVDLMGPLLARLSESLELAPAAKPGVLRQLDESYFQRIDAIEYTVRHDDGRHVEGLPRAEVVLVGVSRTSKTPISIFLAYRGWRVANIPLVLDMEPPEALRLVDKRRIVALTIEPGRLSEVRRARVARMRTHSMQSYTEMQHIRHELDWANLVIRREGWTTIDVTNKSIEESSAEIIALHRSRLGLAVE